MRHKSQDVAEFGHEVRGRLVNSGAWLQVGSRYLPVELGGKRVLVSVRPEIGDKDEDLQPAPEDQVPPETRQVLYGLGTEWEVVAECVFVRRAPGVLATRVSGRRRGDVLELFDWDATRQWRRALCSRTFLQGWVMLDHPELGALLRPRGRLASMALGRPMRPIDPLCEAVREGCIQDVERFAAEGPVDVRDPDGKSPLVLAVLGNHFECCVHLLQAGLQLRDEDLRKLPTDTGAAALCAAVMGYEIRFDAKHALDNAMESSPVEVTYLAQRLLQQGVHRVWGVDA